MLLPRRGQSPARGLAKTTNDPTAKERRDTPDGDVRENYVERFREPGWERRSRTDLRERDVAQNTNVGMNRYSPPPEDSEQHPRHVSGEHFDQHLDYLN
jgi:hypothetical protein